MNDRRETAYRLFAGRDVLAAYLVLLGLVWIGLVADSRALQIPGYVLLLGFDTVQNAVAPGLGSPFFDVYRAGYLYFGAVVIGGLYRANRS